MAMGYFGPIPMNQDTTNYPLPVIVEPVKVIYNGANQFLGLYTLLEREFVRRLSALNFYKSKGGNLHLQQ